jgi:hypothetical protein
VRRTWPLACLLALSCACRESEDVAQTIVFVDAEPAARSLISRVRVQAAGPMDHLEPTVEAKDPEWPIKLVLSPKNNDASRSFTLHIEARDAQDERLMTLRFASGFVANQTRYVKLMIHEACVKAAASCGAGETCNVWSLDLAVDDLGRKADAPDVLDATCAEEDMTPPTAGAGGAGGTTPSGTAGSVSQAGAGAGGAGGSNQAGASGQNGGCGAGYQRRLGVCMDIDECATTNPCGDHGTCQNNPGDYECQ